MPARRAAPRDKKITILLVESDVIVRFAIADYLRTCDVTVIEAASADDAKAILIAGPRADILLSDAQLADSGSGFVLAHWVRRHRPEMEVILTASVASKAQAAADLAARLPECKPPSDAQGLAAKISAMLAERKRRLRQQPRSAGTRTPRRKRG
ncbi:MAG: response regulator [Hyphomonadaceae bacterium]